MITSTEKNRQKIIISAVLILLALAMVITWLEPGSAVWDNMDIQLFRAFNDTLQGQTAWSYFWAFVNWRGFDAIGFVAIALFSIHWIRAKGRDQLPHRLMVMVSYVLIVGVVFGFTILAEKTGPKGRVSERPAPSRVTENDGSGFNDITYRMSWAKAKVKSDNSFPSDHALLAVSMIAFFIMEATPVMAMTAAIVLGFLPFPRMFSGAHWMTDVVVGGLSAVLIIAAIWLLTTSARARILERIEKKFEVHIGRIAKFFAIGLKK